MHSQSLPSQSPTWPAGSGEMPALIRAHDWAATPLGGIESWPQSLKSAVDLILGCDFPMIVLWGPELIQIYNQGYAGIMDGKHPAGLGQPNAECWPEAWAFDEPIFRRVFAGESVTFEDKLIPLARNGPLEDAWFTLCFSPLRDDAAAIVGVLVTVFETTQRVQAATQREHAEAALQGNVGRQKFLLRLSDTLRPLADPVAAQTAATQMLGRRLGVNRAFYVEVAGDEDAFQPGPGYADGVAPMPAKLKLSDFGERAIGDLRAGCTLVIDDIATDERFAGMRSAYAGIDVQAAIGIPLLKDHRLVAILSLHQVEPRHWTDNELTLAGEVAERTWATVERARAEDRLRRRESLSRAQRRVLELAVAEAPLDAVLDMLVRTVEAQSQTGLRGSIMVLDEDGVHLRHGAAPHLPRAVNEALDGLAIGPLAGACGAAAWLKRPVHVTDIATDPRCVDLRALALEHGLLACAAVPILSLRGRTLGTFSTYYGEVREPGAEDSLLAEMAARISGLVIERRREMRHRDLLIHELNHRVKNSLAAVQAVAAQTFRGAGADRALDTFESRLIALSRAHDVLTREHWKGADVREIVRNAVAAWSNDGRARFHVDGPELRLRPSATLALTMALHELLTNAAKYGALSSDAGTITIRWSLAAEAPARFFMQWQERGGPPVRAPSRRGFGSRLIQHGLAGDLGGTVELSFDATGVACRVEAPLDEIREETA